MPTMPTNAIRGQPAGPAIRALVVSTLFPPTDPRDVYGGYQRLRLFIRAIGKLGAQIDVLHVIPEVEIAAYHDLELLQRQVSDYWGVAVSVTLIPRRTRKDTFRNYYLSGILHASEQPEFYRFTGPDQAAAIGRQLDREPDIVFVPQLEAMCAVLRARRPIRNLFFDIDNVDHRVRWRGLRQPPFRPGNLRQLAHLPAIVRAERQAAGLSRLMFVCSEADRRHLRRLGFGRNIVVVPNAVALPAVASPLPSEPSVMFIGNCDYPPNAEAAERLAHRIMPLVRQSVPNATLLLAGRGSDALPSARARLPGIEHLGFIADVNALYGRSRVICCPLSNGGGTRIKLIEGAAYARPLVSTRVGAEGLDFADGEEILLHDDDQALAAACVRVLQDEGLGRRLGAAARQKAIRLYDAENIRDEIAQMMRERMIAR